MFNLSHLKSSLIYLDKTTSPPAASIFVLAVFEIFLQTTFSFFVIFPLPNNFTLPNLIISTSEFSILHNSILESILFKLFSFISAPHILFQCLLKN